VTSGKAIASPGRKRKIAHIAQTGAEKAKVAADAASKSLGKKEEDSEFERY